MQKQTVSLLLIVFFLAACQKQEFDQRLPVPPSQFFNKFYGEGNGASANGITAAGNDAYLVAGSSGAYADFHSGPHPGIFGVDDEWIYKISSNGSVIWDKKLGGTESDAAYDIINTEDGNFITAGFTNSRDGDVIFNHGSDDVWLVKLNQQGNILWEGTYGGSALDRALSIVAAGDGGFVFTGYTQSSDDNVSGFHGQVDAWVVKVNGSGEIVWTKTLGGSQGDFGYSVIEATDGGYVITGQTQSGDGIFSINRGGVDVFVVKLTEAGTIAWQKTFGGSLNDYGRSVTAARDGGYLVAAYVESNDGDISGNHGDRDLCLIKLTSTGNIEWQKCYGGSGNEGVTEILTINKGYSVLGYTSGSTDGDISGSHGNGDIWLLELNHQGKILSNSLYGGSSDEGGNAHLPEQGNTSVIAGYTASADAGAAGFKGTAGAWVFRVKR